MNTLNYHHLYYFWVVTEEGGLSAAARKLRLTHSTLSAQLKTLEEMLGARLFDREGRRLVLTPFGAEVRGYAAEIFHLGQELLEVASGRIVPARKVFRVGAVSTLPKTLTYRLLQPALAVEGHGRVLVRQDKSARLVKSLALGRLDIVLTDEMPVDPSGRIHAHVLGETEILMYGTGALAERLSAEFPRSLNGAPCVLPAQGTTLRRELERWFVERGLSPSVEAEIEDGALLRVFGSMGIGLFPVRAAMRNEVEDLHDVRFVGACHGLRERYYALSAERRIGHPAVHALIEAARINLHPPAAKPGRGP